MEENNEIFPWLGRLLDNITTMQEKQLKDEILRQIHLLTLANQDNQALLNFHSSRSLLNAVKNQFRFKYDEQLKNKLILKYADDNTERKVKDRNGNESVLEFGLRENYIALHNALNEGVSEKEADTRHKVYKDKIAINDYAIRISGHIEEIKYNHDKITDLDNKIIALKGRIRNVEHLMLLPPINLYIFRCCDNHMFYRLCS